MDKVISKDGTPIAYKRSGTGPALVLVHGTSADHTRWATILPLLEPKFTVYAVDRRGRGQSGDSPVYNIEREYEDIASVVGSIREPVNLLGHSYGALCSLEAALMVTNLSRLILYEPPIVVNKTFYPPGVRKRIQDLLDSGDREGLLLTFFREIVRMPGQQLTVLRNEPAWAARLAAAHTISRETTDEDYVFNPQKFKDLNVPTLLMLGGESPDFFKAATGAVHSALTNSRVIIMPGQQHAAMSMEPQMFARLVIEFLMETGDSK
jgi:pimeloyl-ACP methyl ester carboxylesterase